MNAVDILKSRGVTRLCHFTLFKSLTGILNSEDGILASKFINNDVKKINDSERYDGELDHVCCSVEYPNSWYMKRAINDNKDKIFQEWVVLYIDISVLNDRNAKFAPCNASKCAGSYINPNMEEIGKIFAENVPTFYYRRSVTMIPACPTDGQAEILIENNIPVKYIIGIAVSNKDIAGRVVGMLRVCGLSSIKVYIAPDVLSTRWSQMARDGDRAQEELYEG